MQQSHVTMTSEIFETCYSHITVHLTSLQITLLVKPPQEFLSPPLGILCFFYQRFSFVYVSSNVLASISEYTWPTIIMDATFLSLFVRNLL